MHLCPDTPTGSREMAEEFFSSVASLMSNQLRSLTINSLKDFLKFLQIHKVCLKSFELKIDYSKENEIFFQLIERK